MTKEEAIKVLMLLSQLEGFTIGKFGDHCLPDNINKELINVCDMLAKNIDDDTKHRNQMDTLASIVGLSGTKGIE